MTSITYLEAIREAQARALAEDPRVFIYGQDVGAFGGAFKPPSLAQVYPAASSTLPSTRIWSGPHQAAIEGCDIIDHIRRASRRSALIRSSAKRDLFLAHAGQECPVPSAADRRTPVGSLPPKHPDLYAHYPGLIVMTPTTSGCYTMLLEAVAIDDGIIATQKPLLPLKAVAADRSAAHRQARITRAGRDAITTAPWCRGDFVAADARPRGTG
jgi:pyruvate dehydrogenase E1 component beta subunit/2-oxoisovalerate dehydrogenase E1 component beta subunit